MGRKNLEERGTRKHLRLVGERGEDCPGKKLSHNRQYLVERKRNDFHKAACAQEDKCGYRNVRKRPRMRPMREIELGRLLWWKGLGESRLHSLWGARRRR